MALRGFSYPVITPLDIKPDAAKPPFGHHALPPAREALRGKAFKAGGSTNKIASWLISFYRKRALKGLTAPYDVEIEPGLKARLYPNANRCEKRAIAGVQIWDAQERRFLQAAIQSVDDASAVKDFIFLDIGANVGLYSLYAGYYAARAGRNIHIHAVEPDSENARRLIDNARVNGLSLTLWPAAVSDSAGRLSLTPHDDNRGEIKLSAHDQGDSVDVITLDELISQSALPHIDLLKLDIEGHDLRALRRLFENLDNSLYPKYLILEIGTPDDTALMTLCYNQGYVVKGQGRLNIMLERDI